MVSFRFMKLSDAQMVYDWRTAEHVAKYMFTPGPASFAGHLEWMKKILKDRSKVYYIIVCDNQDVGVLNFANLNANEKSGEFGAYIGCQTLEDKRAGVEVETFVIKTFFHVIRFETLYAEVLNFNQGMIKIHESFGFTAIDNPDREHITRLVLTRDRIRFGI